MAARAAAIGTWGKVPDKDRYASLETIQQQTLVVNGKHDLLVPTINSYILQQHLPNATLTIYPDSGSDRQDTEGRHIPVGPSQSCT
jgi:pimeloyl-ACP methyl ester carboxylesterase